MSHAAEKIWRALTRGPVMEEWLMANDFRPVVGHKIHFRGAPMPHWNGITNGEMLIVEPYELLSYSWCASGSESATGLKTVVTWTLTSTRRGCLVRMEQ